MRRARRSRTNHNNEDNSTLTTRDVKSAISEAFKDAMSSGEQQAEAYNTNENLSNGGSDSILDQFRKHRRTE